MQTERTHHNLSHRFTHGGAVLQRTCACGKHSPAGEQCAECRQNQQATLQRAAITPTSSSAPPIVHQTLRTPGQPLDAATRQTMEAGFGHDFSRVRVHADAAADASAQAVNALAYTVGPHVVFAAGQYAPGTPTGQRLLAHELTHVLQQGQSASVPTSLPIGASDSAQEREAASNAQQIGSVGTATTGTVLQREEKKDKVKTTASYGESTEEKKGETKQTTEGSVKVKVPVWSNGRFGPISLLSDAEFKLKLANTQILLSADDPLFKAQLDLAMTLAQLELFKLKLGDFGSLSSKLKLSGGAKGSVDETGAWKGSFGGKASGGLEYTSPPLPYDPYGPQGPRQYGTLTLGASGVLSGDYDTKGKGTLGSGINLSAGYQWPQLYGTQPFVNVQFDLTWTKVGDKVESAKVTTANIGVLF